MVAKFSKRPWWSIAVFVGVFALLVGCAGQSIPWKLSAKYSEELTILAPNYRALTGSDSGDTVNGLRIYVTNGPSERMYNLKSLFKKKLIFETEDKAYIRRFFLAAQQTLTNRHHACSRQSDDHVFHIVAIDNTFMRAGYFVFVRCELDGRSYGMIRSLQEEGGNAVYFNAALIPFLDKIKPTTPSHK